MAPSPCLVLLTVLVLGALPGDCQHSQLREFTRTAVNNRRIGPRVANGTQALPGQFPFAAALYGAAPLDSRGLYQYCGGSLIHPSVILTAAHCTYTYGTTDRVPAYIRVGMTDVTNSSAPNRTVTNIYRHPQYSRITMANDVALLQLNRPIWRVKPVRLAQSFMELSEGDPLVVMGWGHVETQRLSPMLMYTDVSYVNTTECKAYYGVIPSTVLCAGTGKNQGNDACVGDSGGPLMSLRLGVQVGTVSFGPSSPCGEPGHIGGYGNIIALRKWINSQLRIIQRNLVKSTGKTN